MMLLLIYYLLFKYAKFEEVEQFHACEKVKCDLGRKQIETVLVKDQVNAEERRQGTN